MHYFFYGTLLDRRVRQAVIGPTADRLDATRAVLHGWRRVRLEGRAYPVIVPAAGKSVEGCLFGPLAASAATRLSRFEGPEYRIAQVEIVTASGESVSARTFIGSGRTRPTAMDWSFDDWTRTQRAAFLRGLEGRGGRANSDVIPRNVR